MVSKRQREARKLFKDANPDLQSKPYVRQEKPSQQQQKKKKNDERRRSFKSGSFKSNPSGRIKRKSSLGKHPLRIPGMRPGESCFICKSDGHIAKQCPEKAQWDKHKICLLCRKRGHSLQNCTEKIDTSDQKLCYNCGKAGHSLSKCPLPLQDGGTKFASCFVCKERGHLSKNCPRNTNGIYPKGGSCKNCGGIDHLAKHCPQKSHKNSRSSMEVEHTVNKIEVLRSGDDLEDDFMALDAKSEGTKAGFSLQHSGQENQVKGEKNTSVKKKKLQATKVVNFLG